MYQNNNRMNLEKWLTEHEELRKYFEEDTEFDVDQYLDNAMEESLNDLDNDESNGVEKEEVLKELAKSVKASFELQKRYDSIKDTLSPDTRMNLEKWFG